MCCSFVPSPTEENLCRKSIDVLRARIEHVEPEVEGSELQEKEALHDEEEVEVGDASCPMYKQSPFHKHFLAIKSKAEGHIKQSAHALPNVYANPQCITMLLKQMMPYVALWSGIMLKERGISRDTNCHAEIWMAILKRDILGGHMKQNPVKVMKAVRKSLKGRIRRRTLTTKKVAARSKSTFFDAEEKWGEKKRYDEEEGLLSAQSGYSCATQTKV